MNIATIYSAKRIERQFHTGEEPVLVMCSDLNTYVCKYMRSSATAYKLACELIGARMAMAWRLATPDIALVKIQPSHWEGLHQSHSLSSPSIGSKWLDGVVDITPSTYAEVPANKEILYQLMRIALYDFWVANEDRNANNANLMYDVIRGQLVSIDYGCIFNTATFDYPLSQLTSTDTILWSDFFLHLAKSQENNSIRALADRLKYEYEKVLNQCRLLIGQVLADIPSEWNVPQDRVKEKLNQLFDEHWTTGVWNNFSECLNENISHE
ncbi:MAG: hypothetical protein IJ841_02000 [Prevotella sp.]|nr:hypothetical protein [Prevotella sp.]